MNNPSLRHQLLATHLLLELNRWIEAGPNRGYCPLQIDIQFDEDNVFAPDVIWIPHHKLAKGDAVFTGIPDLVVEVRSPSTWSLDIGSKLRTYERAGVTEVWLVDTESQSVIVHRENKLQDGQRVFVESFEAQVGDILTSPLFDGLSVDIGELFDR